MSERNWNLFIMDMVESIEKIENYVSNLSYEDFLLDWKTKDAVVRNLEIIGEAANRIPEEIRIKYDDIPWSQVVGLRHRLIHGYFVVDYEIVWHIVTNELPDLKIKIKRILDKENSAK